MNVIPCLTWVKRGVAECMPYKIELDKDELKKLIEATKNDLDDLEGGDADSEAETTGAVAENGNKTSKKAKKRRHEEMKQEEEEDEDDDIISKYGLDDYEDGEDEDAIISGIGGLSFHARNEEDPYITIPKDVDSDDEDFEIKPTDNLVLACKTHRDHSFLEVYVYNEELGNLFVHHDYLLPSFPLAVEWLNFDPTDASSGNFAAVSTMEPIIEIWNLDVMDCLEPAAVLGSKKSKKKKKKKKAGTWLQHTDAVLALSWNTSIRNVLASASADKTIALWDLAEQKVVTSITEHTDKVQCLKWHPMEAQTLLSGGFDKTVHVYDCRNPAENNKVWTVEGEVEGVLWNTFSPVNFFATTDQGAIYYLDIRKDNQPVYTLKAHTQAVTGLCLSSAIPGLLVTTGDKVMKVWDVDEGKPSLVLERRLKLNQLYCVDSCPEAPFVFAFGGEKDLKVWDIRESAAVRKHFHTRMSAPLQAECEGDDQDIPCNVIDDDDDDVEPSNMAAEDNSDEEEETIQEMAAATGMMDKKKKKKKKKKKNKAALEL